MTLSVSEVERIQQIEKTLQYVFRCFYVVNMRLQYLEEQYEECKEAINNHYGRLNEK